MFSYKYIVKNLTTVPGQDQIMKKKIQKKTKKKENPWFCKIVAGAVHHSHYLQMILCVDLAHLCNID